MLFTPHAIGRKRTNGSRFRRLSSKNRKAVAAVETALMLPLLVVLAFGSIEIANAVFLKQALALASYEGVRTAARPGGTAAEAEARMIEVLAARGVTNYTLGVTPQVTSTTSRGTMVTCQVSANAGMLGLGPLRFVAGFILQKQTTMVRL